MKNKVIAYILLVVPLIYLGCNEDPVVDKADASFSVTHYSPNDLPVATYTNDDVTIVMDTVFTAIRVGDAVQIEKSFSATLKIEFTGSGYSKSFWPGDQGHNYESYLQQVDSLNLALGAITAIKKDSVATLNGIIRNSGLVPLKPGTNFVVYTITEPGEYKFTCVSTNASTGQGDAVKRDVKTKVVRIVKPS